MMNNIKQSLQALTERKCLQACILFVSACLLSLGQLHAADGLLLKDVHLKADKPTQVAIQLNNEASYTAFQLDITLPEGVELVASEGEYEVVLAGRAAGTHALTVSSVGDGAFRVLAYSSQNEAFSGQSGDLLLLTLKATEDFEGPSTISITHVLFTTTAIREVKFPDVSAVCDVRNYLQGDVNNDGRVDLTDAIMIVYRSLGSTPAGFVEEAADVSDDNRIDLTDAITVVYMSLGGSSSGSGNTPDPD